MINVQSEICVCLKEVSVVESRRGELGCGRVGGDFCRVVREVLRVRDL